MTDEAELNAIDIEQLALWEKMSHELKALKAREIMLRKRLFGVAFPHPVEGTNKFELNKGYILKGMQPYDRKVDEGAFAAIKEQLRELEVIPEDLIEYKPALKKAKYNHLSDKQKLLFDQCLIIKPGTPSMEIVLPARVAAAQAMDTPVSDAERLL